MDLQESARLAQGAAQEGALLPTALKNALLLDMAASLDQEQEALLAANRTDVEQARSAGLSAALLDRLTLSERRIAEMAAAVRQVAALEDPLQEVVSGYNVPSGLRVIKKRVPFGVVGVIYEARPNVTVDIAALCLKSGNACLLRGGSEAQTTNSALHELLVRSLEKFQVDVHLISMLKGASRATTLAMLKLDEYLDLIIPRGGAQLQRLCIEEASVPVITGGFGVSHIFIDYNADLPRSLAVVLNAKTQKPAACNALDTLLLHPAIAAQFLELAREALASHHITLHVAPPLQELLRGYAYLQPLAEGDLDREWLALDMAVVQVADVQAAVRHLHAHQAIHSDAILTNDLADADYFVAHAPSACVYVNASTRFSDGGQFGLGSEVAISTQKLHVRGPMGLRELTTFQYVLSGDYLVRS